ncbi:MAG TPA: hypothetical protein PK583_00125 [Gammaproteobacteria bacterium]|nr:hypothetical protein [Gammaproteobacteria bacterium]
MEILTKQSVFAVGHYLWCAAVTNVFMIGIVQTASLAGAQVNAVRALHEFKAGIAEAVTQQEAEQDLRDDLTGRRKLK